MSYGNTAPEGYPGSQRGGVEDARRRQAYNYQIGNMETWDMERNMLKEWMTTGDAEAFVDRFINTDKEEADRIFGYFFRQEIGRERIGTGRSGPAFQREASQFLFRVQQACIAKVAPLHLQGRLQNLGYLNQGEKKAIALYTYIEESLNSPTVTSDRWLTVVQDEESYSQGGRGGDWASRRLREYNRQSIVQMHRSFVEHIEPHLANQQYLAQQRQNTIQTSIGRLDQLRQEFSGVQLASYAPETRVNLQANQAEEFQYSARWEGEINRQLHDVLGGLQALGYDVRIENGRLAGDSRILPVLYALDAGKQRFGEEYRPGQPLYFRYSIGEVRRQLASHFTQVLGASYRQNEAGRWGWHPTQESADYPDRHLSTREITDIYRLIQNAFPTIQLRLIADRRTSTVNFQMMLNKYPIPYHRSRQNQGGSSMYT